MPDHRLDFTRVVVGEDGAGVEYIITGTHTGDFPGLPSSGKSIRFRTDGPARPSAHER